MDLEHGSRSSKHLEIVRDGSGGSKHSETNPKVLEGSGSSKPSETHPNIIESDVHPKVLDSETHPKVIDSEAHPKLLDGSGGSKHSETHPKVTDGSDSNNHSTIHPEAAANKGALCASSGRLINFSSSSSAASELSLDDLFQVDTNKITTSMHITSLPKHHDLRSLGPASTSQVSDVTIGSMVHGISPTESPSIQMMERIGGYDPYRIPASVFEKTKSNNELEWSVASNESLFSIHLGNNSFSRDQMLMLGDLGKSGELTKSGELFVFSPPAPVPEVEIERNSIEEGRESGAEGAADEAKKDTASTSSEDHSEGRVPPPTVSLKSPSLSRRSDGSGASTRSFAFPIRKKRAWPLSYCSNCSWAFCYGTWPSCYCSNCSWAFCYPWNCSQKRMRCDFSTILTDGMKPSVKVTQGTEEQCLEPPAAKILNKKANKPKVTYWLRCFSWCKWGCSCHHRRWWCCCY